MPADLPPWQPKKPRGFTRPPTYYVRKAIDWLENQLAGPALPIAVGQSAVITQAGILQGSAGEIVGVSEGSVRLRLFRGGEVSVAAEGVAVIALGPAPG